MYLFVLVAAFCLIIWGRFWYLEPKGKYGVGHREIILKGRDTNPVVSIYYPIDKKYYKKHRNDNSMTSEWTIEKEKTIEAFNHMTGVPKWILSFLRAYRLRAVNSAELHKDFAKKSKELTPVIFSHGLMGNRAIYSSIINQLVGNGCIVYALDHTDGTCNYYCDRSGDEPKDILFEGFDKNKHDVTYKEFITSQLEHRTRDIKVIIDLVKEEASTNMKCINLDKLVSMGHSMGGGTAIESARLYEQDFKLWVAFDPYLYPIFKSMDKEKNYGLKQPVCLINSSGFNKRIDFYDQPGTTAKILDNSIKKGATNWKDIVIENSSHVSQCDIVIMLPFLISVAGVAPRLSSKKGKYLELCNIIVAFLDEHDFFPTKLDIHVEDYNKNN